MRLLDVFGVIRDLPIDKIQYEEYGDDEDGREYFFLAPKELLKEYGVFIPKNQEIEFATLCLHTFSADERGEGLLETTYVTLASSYYDREENAYMDYEPSEITVKEEDIKKLMEKIPFKERVYFENSIFNDEQELMELSYDLYKEDWIRNHIPFREYKKEYRKFMLDDNYETFDDYIEENGFRGEIYASFEEFVECEYNDEHYMEYLLGEDCFIAYKSYDYER